MTMTVKTWRDDVSFKLGQIIEKQDSMHEDIKETNGKVIDHEGRLDVLEKKEVEKAAVKKFSSWLWATFGAGAMWGLQQAWPLIKKLLS